jgi:probable phosphoglycerate mutase
VTSPKLPAVWIARHGETEWSLAGRHTGRSDIDLTPRGEEDARRLGERLRDLTFTAIFTSPSKRAVRTCALAGFGDRAVPDSDLGEWDYGDYEGLRTAEIRNERPSWKLFYDGCPGGESPSSIGERADRVVAKIRAIDGDVLLVSSAHLLRILTVRWLRLPVAAGQYFVASPAGLGCLGYEHDRSEPAIRLWNDTRHLVENHPPAASKRQP